MPRVVTDLVSPEATLMLADDLAVLADHDTVCVRRYLYRLTDGAGHDTVGVAVEAHQARLRDRGHLSTVAIE